MRMAIIRLEENKGNSKDYNTKISKEETFSDLWCSKRLKLMSKDCIKSVYHLCTQSIQTINISQFTSSLNFSGPK